MTSYESCFVHLSLSQRKAHVWKFQFLVIWFNISSPVGKKGKTGGDFNGISYGSCVTDYLPNPSLAWWEGQKVESQVDWSLLDNPKLDLGTLSHVPALESQTSYILDLFSKCVVCRSSDTVNKLEKVCCGRIWAPQLTRMVCPPNLENVLLGNDYVTIMEIRKSKFP